MKSLPLETRRKMLRTKLLPQLVEPVRVSESFDVSTGSTVAKSSEDGGRRRDRSDRRGRTSVVQRSAEPSVFPRFSLLLPVRPADLSWLRSASATAEGAACHARDEDHEPPVRSDTPFRDPSRESARADRAGSFERFGGLIAKRIDSVYEAGKRSGRWVKLRVNRSQEFCHRRLRSARRQLRFDRGRILR